MDIAAMRKFAEQTSKEEQAKEMAKWGEWMKTNMASFADPGAPVGKNTRVTAGSTKEESNDVGGYAIMQGESAEAVAKIVASSPHVHMPGALTDIMEIVSMPGM